jgi:hypothetical protein
MRRVRVAFAQKQFGNTEFGSGTAFLKFRIIRFGRLKFFENSRTLLVGSDCILEFLLPSINVAYSLPGNRQFSIPFRIGGIGFGQLLQQFGIFLPGRQSPIELLQRS